MKKGGVEYIEPRRMRWEELKAKIPKYMYSTRKTWWFFIAIISIVAIINVTSFNFLKLMSPSAMDSEIVFRVGWPMDFIAFNFFNPEELPIKFGGLIVDCLLYLLIAYCLDILFNYLLKQLTKEEIVRKKITAKAKPKIVPKNVELRPFQTPIKE